MASKWTAGARKALTRHRDRAAPTFTKPKRYLNSQLPSDWCSAGADYCDLCCLPYPNFEYHKGKVTHATMEMLVRVYEQRYITWNPRAVLRSLTTALPTTSEASIRAVEEASDLTRLKTLHVVIRYLRDTGLLSFALPSKASRDYLRGKDITVLLRADKLMATGKIAIYSHMMGESLRAFPAATAGQLSGLWEHIIPRDNHELLYDFLQLGELSCLEEDLDNLEKASVIRTIAGILYPYQVGLLGNTNGGHIQMLAEYVIHTICMELVFTQIGQVMNTVEDYWRRKGQLSVPDEDFGDASVEAAGHPPLMSDEPFRQSHSLGEYRTGGRNAALTEDSPYRGPLKAALRKDVLRGPSSPPDPIPPPRLDAEVPGGGIMAEDTIKSEFYQAVAKQRFPPGRLPTHSCDERWVSYIRPFVQTQAPSPEAAPVAAQEAAPVAARELS